MVLCQHHRWCYWHNLTLTVNCQIQCFYCIKIIVSVERSLLYVCCRLSVCQLSRKYKQNVLLSSLYIYQVLSVLFYIIMLLFCCCWSSYHSYNIQPIPKGGKDPFLSVNYRGIGLASSLSKVLEWSILPSWNQYFPTNDFQFGFKSWLFHYPMYRCLESYCKLLSEIPMSMPVW